jgi:hypothetical protein
MGLSKTNIVLEEKKSKWPTQKTKFFKTINSQYFFAKLSGIGP